MAEEKVYYPETITDMPLPIEPGVSIMPSGGINTSTGAQAPSSISSKGLRRKVFSHETISQSLNTKTKRILDNFQLTKQGGIQIGEYENGVSGDIRLSPAGMTARDTAGNTTFALDGETGAATFAGEVLAKDFTIIDENGLISLSAFDSDSVTNSSFETITPTSSSWQDLTGMVLTIPDYGRSVKVLLLFTVTYDMDSTVPTGVLESLQMDLLINGSSFQQTSINSSWNTDNRSRFRTDTIHSIREVSSGEHTIKVIWARSGPASPIGTVRFFSRTLSFLVLGR